MDNTLSNMSYTNKSFNEVYSEMLSLAEKISYRWNPKESNESDPGVVLLKLCAILADKLNYNIDKNVLECFPVSVTQEKNARELFAQLGYFMKWYIGANGEIQISWKGEDTGYIYTLPRFSMVSNDDNTIVFTLTSDVAISSDGSVATCNAIQGVVQDFMVNGDTVITTQNLDSKNRIYFSNCNIAENGIFIKNSLFGYDEWRKVDNLNVEPFGSPVYKFGVSQDTGVCYLEFPEDAYNIFADGITIKYISTDGQDGNVSPKIINKFFNDPSAIYIDDNSDEQSILLTTENIYVTNIDSIKNGSNPESIEDAYKNYQRTIGTFDTLVTLRDYNNAIRNAKINNIGIVSNGFVTDRTNDIQCSYKIVTDVQDVVKTVYSVEEQDDSPSIGAFDLKLYLLENVNSSGDVVQQSSKSPSSAPYNTTFNMLDNTDYSESYKIDMIRQYISDEKCVQHDFQPLLSNKLCMLKNKYPIECKIIPQYKLTAVQANSVKSNIIVALYNSLNARKVEFGDEISYDYLYNVIVNADERIKSVMLGDIVYTTYAVYYNPEENRYVEVEINSLDNFISGYFNPSNDRFYYQYDSETGEYQNQITVVDNILYKDCISTEQQTTKEIYVTNKEALNILNQSNIRVGTKIMAKFRYDALSDNSEETPMFIKIINSQSGEIVGSVAGIKESINGTFQDLSSNKSLSWQGGSTRLLTFNGTYWIIDFEGNYSDKNSLYTFVDLNTGTCYKYTDGKASNYIKSDIQTDIYAKSVLGGVTQLLKPDDIFEYRMNQRFVDYINDVANISTNTNIHLESPSGEASKVLQDNECIRFYSPNLEDDTTYSSYVKFQYAIAQDVEMDSDYMLQNDETITFYWKESDDDNAYYKYYKYGAGTIIHPNFTMRSSVGYMSLDESNSEFGTSYSHSLDDIQYIGLKYQNGSGLCSYGDTTKLASIYNNDYILSSTKSVTIRKKVEATIKYPMFAYWILNKKRYVGDGRYVYQLFSETSVQPGESEIRQTYILQPGEYFIYTNSAKTSMEILSAGTKITRTSSLRKVEPMVCDVAETDEILDSGISSADDILKQINFNETITATEMQIKTVPSNATLYLSALSWEPDASASLSPSELTGIRIYGNGNSPTSGNQQLKASQGRTVYNNEYSSTWQWHEEDLYSESGNNYSDNINISQSTQQPSGKTPTMMGIIPSEDYVNVSTLSAPEFYDGDFYQLVNGEYIKLEKEPADWSTGFMNYYWQRPYHAYNPKFSSSVVWEDDNNLAYEDSSPYVSSWSEDADYIALGYVVEEENMFPDLIKLNSTPTDYEQCGYIEQSDPYIFGYWWNLSGKTQQEINSIMYDLATVKYFKCGNDWYQNMRYNQTMGESLPKTTYHAYNPKFRFNGYIWNESEAPEDAQELSEYIKITGEGSSPQNCIIVPQKGLIVYWKYNGLPHKVWWCNSYGYAWQQIQSKPADADLMNTLSSIITDVSTFDREEYYNQYIYLSLGDPDNKTWYQKITTSEGTWSMDYWDNYSSEQKQQILNNGIEIQYDVYLDNNLSNALVSIIPKQGMKSVNIPTEMSAVEVYDTTYFSVVEDYIEKSWTQTIIFDSSVQQLSGNSYISPETENIQPSVGNHACHQHQSYVWLEDYSYAFEDSSAFGTSNVIGNSRSVSGVGVSPISEGIVATQGAKAYNTAYSYNYEWQEDSQFISWQNPIAIISGQYTPMDYNISPLALDQHVINPEYEAKYKWVRLNSIPQKYKTSSVLDADIRTGVVLTFESSDTNKEPWYNPAESYKGGARYAYNYGVNPNVWYQLTPIYGKSWTSVRVPVGKSWTAYECVVSDSWSGVNEYVGKSWYSSMDNIPMLWRSVPTSVNVIFRKDGAEIISPSGYTLNDFVIKSKLESSSEVEEWPKVIVDDGWEAYSSLDINVSKNTPFEIHENQEIEWFSKDYDISNDTPKTHGVISGRYEFKDGAIDTTVYQYVATISNVQSESFNTVSCSILPENNAHLYCKETLKSWISEYSYTYEQDPVYTEHDDSIVVQSESEINPDRAGMHYVLWVNGNPISYTSYQSAEQHWSEESSYNEYGIQVLNVTSVSQSSIEASIKAQQFVALSGSQRNYISAYVPIYMLSDYGYNIEGGNMIDVSRMNADGNTLYMNIYSYEMINYSDSDISVDGNLLKINVNYSEYTKIDSSDDTWQSGRYYGRTGSGTQSDPYYYAVLTAKPSDWDNFETRVYYKKTNILDENYSITKEVDFNFMDGRYLLKFTNSSPDIEELTIDISPISDGVVSDYRVRLSEFGDSDFYNFGKSRKYYVSLDLEQLKNNSTEFANSDMLRLYLNIRFKAPSNNYYETKGYLTFDLSYKFDKPSYMSEDFFNAIVNKIGFLDPEKLYDFSYIVDKDVEIENPIDSSSFLDKNHIYNKFTICQIDTENTSVYITNSTK